MPKLLSPNTYHYRRGGGDAMFSEHNALFRGLGWETAVMSTHHSKNDPSSRNGSFVNLGERQ